MDLLWPPAEVRAPPIETMLFREIADGSLDLQNRFRSLSPGQRLDVPGIVISALNEELQPLPLGGREIRGRRNFGVTFFVDPALGQGAREVGNSLDGVIAGSTWNAVLLEAAGVSNVSLVIQGIDTGAFSPAPKTGLLRDRYVVFSGGKLEFRKGQDIVLAAFRSFKQRHPEALLMAAWNNGWAQSAATIALSPLGVPAMPADGNMNAWLAAQGFARDDVLLLPDLPNFKMAAMMREADLAVFPNRCEPGTNLVAMEAMALGLPTVLSANTGHLDFADPKICYPLTRQGRVQDVPFHRSTEGWGECEVDELLETMERAYHRRGEAAALADAAAERLKAFSWTNQLDRLLSLVDET